jgi:hypothetical protein
MKLLSLASLSANASPAFDDLLVETISNYPPFYHHPLTVTKQLNQ